MSRAFLVLIDQRFLVLARAPAGPFDACVGSLYINVFLDGDSNANLNQVLIFATGASVPFPMGFDNTPSLEFVHGEFPYAPVLHLPFGHHELDHFKEKMDFGILNSPCFGCA